MKDKDELKSLGLTEEDISGYEEFFIESYFPSGPSSYGDN